LQFVYLWDLLVQLILADVEMRSCTHDWLTVLVCFGVCTLEHLRANNLLRETAAQSRKDGQNVCKTINYYKWGHSAFYIHNILESVRIPLVNRLGRLAACL
jgi:hypothetical protein